MCAARTARRTRGSYAAAECDALRSRSQQAEAPPDELKSKPATRPAVFGEPWDASWLWFLISESKPRRAQSEVVCKSISVDTARSAIAGASETLLAELCISKERSGRPRPRFAAADPICLANCYTLATPGLQANCDRGTIKRRTSSHDEAAQRRAKTLGPPGLGARLPPATTLP